MATQSFQFSVEMNCNGCANAVRNSLNKVSGVSKIDVNLEKQLVVVESTASADQLQQAIQKTGKKVSLV